MTSELSPDLQQELQNLLSSFLKSKKVSPEEIHQLSQKLKIDFSLDDIREKYRSNLASDLKKMQDEVRESRIESLLKNSEINSFWDFKNITNGGDPGYSMVVEACKNWIDQFDKYENENCRILQNGQTKIYQGGSLIYLYGEFGVGKSMIAGAMCRKLMIEQLREVLLIQWYTLYSKIIGSNNETERKNYKEKLENVDLLVIDEVAVNNTSLTEAQIREFGCLLRARKNNKRNTIIISNCAPQALCKCVGTFGWESMKNYEPTFSFHLIGPNRRQRTIGGFDNLNMADLNSLKSH